MRDGRVSGRMRPVRLPVAERRTPPGTGRATDRQPTFQTTSAALPVSWLGERLSRSPWKPTKRGCTFSGTR
ncbi:hypothetical protein GCM10010425_42800 [Streptomyces spororaveus]